MIGDYQAAAAGCEITDACEIKINDSRSPDKENIKPETQVNDLLDASDPHRRITGNQRDQGKDRGSK